MKLGLRKQAFWSNNSLFVIETQILPTGRLYSSPFRSKDSETNWRPVAVSVTPLYNVQHLSHQNFTLPSEIISGRRLGGLTTVNMLKILLSTLSPSKTTYYQYASICERETTDFITVAVSAFKEKWYTQNVTERSRLELHQEGERTFSYFSSIFDTKFWRVMLSQGGIYAIHNCSDIETCFIFLPNPRHVCNWIM